MANENVINTRIGLKIDLLANWQSKNPELLPGEVAFVQIGETTTDSNGKRVIPPVMFKVGPGHFNDLGWGAAKAADVYAWAKKTGIEIEEATQNEEIKNNEEYPIVKFYWDADAEKIKFERDIISSKAVYFEGSSSGGYAGNLYDCLMDLFELRYRIDLNFDYLVDTLKNNDGTKTLKAVYSEAGFGEDGKPIVEFEAIDIPIPTSADFGVLSVEGEDAIAVDKTDAQNPTIKLKINETQGNVALSQDTNGLKAEIDLSSYALIGTNEDTENTDSVKGAKKYADERKAEVVAMIDGVASAGLTRSIVSTLPDPANAALNTIYMIKRDVGLNEKDVYDEYILVEVDGTKKFELLGNTELDLSNYYTKDEIENKNYKVKQTSVADPTANGSALEFIDTITQNENGVISATKKTVNLTNYKTKQEEKNFDGSTVKTVINVSQNANGEVEVVYDDIAFPPAPKGSGDVAIATIENDIVTLNGGVKLNDHNLEDDATKADITLAKIAKTGSVYDVAEGSNVSTGTDAGVKYLVFNCGSASTVI